MRSLLLILLLFASFDGWANCPEFETILQKAAVRFEARISGETAEKAAQKKVLEEALNTPTVLKYKERYSKDFALPPNSNRDYMKMAEMDARAQKSNVLYFDVENSIQKKLNDSVFGEKTMVDSVNNAFMERMFNNIKNNPQLASRLKGQYKDYKSLRLRLELRPGDNRAMYEKLLEDTYQKSASEFEAEISKLNIKHITNPRTDEVPNTERWFLAGSGDTPVAANMAARGAREKLDKGILHYQDHIPELHQDVLGIEALRSIFANDKHLVDLKILDKLSDGHLIPSKDMIGILRKTKRSDCATEEEYFLKMHDQVKKMFGKDITDENIRDLTNYFRKVDSLSPPLFSRERVEINLADAHKGIVSIDFTGVGVDNAYQQMSALARLNYKQTDKALMLKEAFGEVQAHVDQVTVQMNNSKKYFSNAVKKVSDETHAPLFSGDDGIYMPKTDNWSLADKKKLIAELGKAEDPSKFRVTFVNSTYTNSKVISPEARSALIVKAEKFEKKLREKIIGVEGISSEEAKKIITAIDFVPTSKGGIFRVLVGGKTLTKKEKELIEKMASKSVSTTENELFGGLEVVSGN